jgi:hypothetical protein
MPEAPPASRPLTPVVPATAMVGVFVFKTLAANFMSRYTSDGVAQQVILHLWRRGMHQAAVTGPDTYLLKMPLYRLLSSTSLSPLAQLRAASLILAVLTGVFLFLTLYLLVAPRALARTTGVAAAVLCAGGNSFFGQWTNANVRNLELAVGFFVVAWLSTLLKQSRPFGRDLAMFVVFALTAGLLALNDPYFLYVFLVPASAALGSGMVTRDRWRRRMHMLALGAVVAALGAFEVLTFGMNHLLKVGTFGSRPGLAGPDQLSARSTSFSRGVQVMFDIGVSKRHGLAPANVLGSLRLAIVFGSLAFCVYQLVRWRRLSFAERALFGIAPAVSVAFIASSLTTAPRYLVVLPLCAAVYLALLSLCVRGRTLAALVALVAASGILGATLSGQSLITNWGRSWNERNVQLVDSAQRLDLTKGYASYWNSNINTFMSGYHVSFVPVNCSHRTLRFRKWLIDRAALSESAGQSFYLWQDGECTATDLRPQFGAPLMQLEAAPGFHIAVYHYDIAKRFPRLPAH